MYLLAPFILQNFRKFLEPIQSYEDLLFLGRKWPNSSEQFFFVQTIITFIYLLALFIVQNLKKFLQQVYRSRVMRMCHFWAQNGPFAWYSYLPISPFHCAKLKKNSSSGSRVMRICNFCTENGSFPQMRIFSENLLMSLVSFIHAYLHAKNQSQILIY